jgi:hypothetical protein
MMRWADPNPQVPPPEPVVTEHKVQYVEIPKSYLFTPEEAAKRELWARRFAAEIAGCARGLGYGVFTGGSFIRDIDLIAVPWRRGGSFIGRAGDKKSDYLTHIDFVLELVHCFPLTMGNHGETLFGHRWYALWHVDHPDHQIDLKVVLPAAPNSTTET